MFYSSGYEFDDINYIEDSFPTRFSITDRLKDKYKLHDVEGIFNKLETDVILIGDNNTVRYYAYCIGAMIYRKWEKKLEASKIPFDIKEVKTIIKELENFRRAFEHEPDF